MMIMIIVETVFALVAVVINQTYIYIYMFL